MKIYPVKQYTEIVRVEIRNKETGEMRSVSFCDTTLDEVINHVNQTMKVGIVGTKVHLNIRISDKEKRWGKQKNSIVFINDIDQVLNQITNGITILNWTEFIAKSE